MARVCTLFSGSKGNSTYVGCSSGGLLIDAGVSAKALTQALHDRDIPLSSIGGIFITHEHGDHVRGVRVFASRHGIPIYASAGTLSAMEKRDCLRGCTAVECVAGTTAVVSDLAVNAFPVPHDGCEPTGYTVETPDGRRIGVCTDLGYVSDAVRSALRGSDLLLLESNHDRDMLKTGAYPYPLKQRIAGDGGHLSNDDCACELPALVEQGTTRLILGHLSQENNRPRLAFDTAEQALSCAGFRRGSDYLLAVAALQGGGMVVL